MAIGKANKKKWTSSDSTIRVSLLLSFLLLSLHLICLMVLCLNVVHTYTNLKLIVHRVLNVQWMDSYAVIISRKVRKRLCEFSQKSCFWKRKLLHLSGWNANEDSLACSADDNYQILCLLGSSSKLKLFIFMFSTLLNFYFIFPCKKWIV